MFFFYWTFNCINRFGHTLELKVQIISICIDLTYEALFLVLYIIFTLVLKKNKNWFNFLQTWCLSKFSLSISNEFFPLWEITLVKFFPLCILIVSIFIPVPRYDVYSSITIKKLTLYTDEVLFFFTKKIIIFYIIILKINLTIQKFFNWYLFYTKITC